MERSSYPSDLTAEQWELVRRMIPPAEPGGRHRSVDMREVLNGILYMARSGCVWRALPHEFPPWGTVHYYDQRFRLDGSWQKIHDALRTKVRHKAGRRKIPARSARWGSSRRTHAAVTARPDLVQNRGCPSLTG